MAFTIKSIEQIKINNWFLLELEFDPNKKSAGGVDILGRKYFPQVYLDLVSWLKENVGTEYLIQYKHNTDDKQRPIVKVALSEVNAIALRLAL